MYGYVLPQKNVLKESDFVLYRAFYCGLCKATGSLYGQLPRLTTNHDMTFFSVLLHDCLTQDVRITESACVLNPVRKKAVIGRNALLDRLAAVNILLSYHKASDGVIDGEGIKYRAVRRVLRRSYQKARALCPGADAAVVNGYAALRALEEENCPSLDRVSHCFSAILRDIASDLLGAGADENILGLCYNVGKFVYLADALDDIDEDRAKKRYNPFLAAFGGYDGRRAFIERNRNDIEFALSSALNRATECFNGLKLTQSNTLLTNIVHRGMRAKMRELLESAGKLPPPKI